MRRQWKAWAVELLPRSERDGASLAGRYYFGRPSPWMEGCVSALFKTRREAKAHQPHGLYSRRTRIVRVTLTLEAQ